MLTKQEVQHIAKLARLELSDEELERYRKDLSSILDYVAQFRELDVGGVIPMSHSIDVENVFREDIPQKDSIERINTLLEAAPQKERGYVRTKGIL